MVSHCSVPGVAWTFSTVAQGCMRQEAQKWPSIYSTMFYWSKQTQVKASPDSSVPVAQIQRAGRVDPISQENLMVAVFEVKLMYILIFLYPPLPCIIPGCYMLSPSHTILGCLPLLLLRGEYH